MKTTLYYFSGTGNTLYLAQRLADELGQTELISITSALKNETLSPTSENVGILFPVYCFGTPNIIKDFVTKLNISESQYLFGVASYGGLLSRALSIFKNECSKAGLSLNAGFAVQMPGNAISTYGAISNEKIEQFEEQFETRIPEIAQSIKAQQTSKMETRQFLFQPLMSAVHPIFMKQMPKESSKFFTTESCKLCGDCVKVCPVDNISIENKTVIWGDKCEQCMACIQWCENESIQLGAKTAARKRYHHNCISKTDIMVQGE
jgi:ferredoxin